MKDVTIIYSPSPFASNRMITECFIYTSPASLLMKKLTLPLN